MEVKKQTKLTFHGVDIVNINFNAIAPPKGELKIDINCAPKIFYPLDDKNFFNIIMDVTLKDERYFELALRAIGHFEIVTDLNVDMRKIFINSNAPAIMFPYIRSFISTITVNMGNSVGAIVIPTHFFKGELEEIKE